MYSTLSHGISYLVFTLSCPSLAKSVLPGQGSDVALVILDAGPHDCIWHNHWCAVDKDKERNHHREEESQRHTRKATCLFLCYFQSNCLDLLKGVIKGNGLTIQLNYWPDKWLHGTAIVCNTTAVDTRRVSTMTLQNTLKKKMLSAAILRPFHLDIML